MEVDEDSDQQLDITTQAMCGSRRGGQGVRTPPTPRKITKILGSLAILVQIPLKSQKLPSQNSMLCHHRPASETPSKWRLAGGSLMANL